MTTSIPQGIYLITPDDRPFPEIRELLARLLPHRPAMLQYRDKRATSAERERRAASLAALCREYEVPLIINDDPHLAAAVGAAGAHLGRDDGSLAAARARLGATAILGWSCYADLGRARNGAGEGASYLAFGSVFPSPTKPDAAHAPLELLRRARREFALPICAIGGIGRDQTETLAALGVDLVAVISGVFSAPDPLAAFLELQRAFLEGRTEATR
jgi:thiamine-phosphate pyrophosphorylase